MGPDSQVDEIIQKIESGGFPTADEVKYITTKSKELFSTYPNVIKVRSPVTICGDIHGQFDDLIELFKINGRVPFTDYLFMGDYVDRGNKSVETVTYLFALKLKYPDHITLLRGNHESAGVSQHFGFRDEVLKRYGNETVWKIYINTFNSLPLAALVNNKVLCIHGGLSPGIKTINDIEKIDRFKEIPHDGPMCDLLWSDPSTTRGFEPSIRDAGYQFGPDITKSWNDKNGLDLTVRAHQLVMTGLEYAHDNQIVTIFSAPDYCLRCGNTGGVLELDEKMRRKEIRFATPRLLDNSSDEVPSFFQLDSLLDI